MFSYSFKKVIWILKLITRIFALSLKKNLQPRWKSWPNVAYKIISKILASRLKPWLKDIISVNQTAFILERYITDNILIVHELLHSLTSKKLAMDYMALKLDITKAFDKVEWSYLDAVIERMGFHINGEVGLWNVYLLYNIRYW